jgi:hypothetical protein
MSTAYRSQSFAALYRALRDGEEPSPSSLVVFERIEEDLPQEAEAD